MLRFGTATLVMIAVTPACAAPERTSDVREIQGQSAAARSENQVTNAALPLNQRFRSLDAYLLYLQNVVGPSDGAWYRMIRPGVYQLETGNKRRMMVEGEPPAPPEKTVFTREELKRKFGFSE